MQKHVDHVPAMDLESVKRIIYGKTQISQKTRRIMPQNGRKIEVLNDGIVNDRRIIIEDKGGGKTFIIQKKTSQKDKRENDLLALIFPQSQDILPHAHCIFSAARIMIGRIS